MVLMKYFFFCIPVRLGVIITSATSIIENGIGLIWISMYSANDLSNYADGFRDKSKDNSYDSSSEDVYEVLIEYVKKYPVEIFYTSIGIFAGCIAACVLNILASIYKSRILSIPYILIKFFQITVIFVLHVNYMLYKKKTWNLGLLIAACCAGGFFILFLLYLWGVTVALFQILGVVNSKEYKELLAQNQEPAVVVRKPRYQGVINISSGLDDYSGPKMIASDFNGVRKQDKNAFARDFQKRIYYAR